MLGLLLIYFVGRAFYRLAETHKRSKWLFAILGVVTYYVTQFLFALGLLSYMMSRGREFTSGDELVITLVGILVGGIGVSAFYAILKRAWEKKPRIDNNELLDQI
ncbi:MAG: hypothetical protein QE487_09535 [Fluviicola sp.]|nr:hypothetical protein [Fluviicola sp.]